jgi:hypothetical protein
MSDLMSPMRIRPTDFNQDHTHSHSHSH